MGKRSPDEHAIAGLDGEWTIRGKLKQLHPHGKPKARNLGRQQL
jgi:hypothetical protein